MHVSARVPLARCAADQLLRSSGFKFAQIELSEQIFSLLGRSKEFSLMGYVAAEAVLFVLLQRFRFEPTGDPIAWNSAPVQYPTVGKVSEDPALPLKVTLMDP